MPNFFFVLAAILLASIADSLFLAEDKGNRPAMLAAAMALLPVVLGEIAHALRTSSNAATRRLFLGATYVSPLALYATLLFFGDWVAFAKHNDPWQLEISRLGFLLAPFALLKASQWIAFRRIASSLPGVASGPVGPSLRMFFFAAMPVLLFLAATDLLAQFRETRTLLAAVGLARFVVMAAFFALLVLSLPWAARKLWNTTPLPRGPLRERLEATASRFRFRCRDILVWNTGTGAVNAAILGLFPRFRYVILTDGLLASLPPAEIEGVFGHELGHACRHHVAAFFAYVLGFLLLLLLFVERVAGETVWGLGATLATLAGLWFFIGALSRRFELEADLFGAGATSDPMVFIEALEKVGAYSGRGRWHGSWRHFSVAERVYFLMHVASDSAKLLRFERHMRWARWGGASILFVAVGLHAALLTRELPADLAEMYLRRGQFERAEEAIFPVRFDSERTKGLLTMAETGIRFRDAYPEDWPQRLASQGRALFLDRRFSAAYYHLALGELLEVSGAQSGKLAQAALLLARNDDKGINEFIRFGEGKSLLQDPEIFRIFYPN